MEPTRPIVYDSLSPQRAAHFRTLYGQARTLIGLCLGYARGHSRFHHAPRATGVFGRSTSLGGAGDSRDCGTGGEHLAIIGGAASDVAVRGGHLVAADIASNRLAVSGIIDARDSRIVIRVR